MDPIPVMCSISGVTTYMEAWLRYSLSLLRVTARWYFVHAAAGKG